MILGYGIDLVHLPRIASLITRRGLDPLVRRILCPAERDLLRARFPQSSTTSDHPAHAKQVATFMAVRWAAKEAFYKAVYPSYRPTWQQLAVLPEGPKPTLVLNGPLAGQGLRTHLSISHDGDHLIAGVIVERDGDAQGTAGKAFE